MNIEDIMLLEIEGITNTIKDYTRDNFVISYAKRLKDLSYPDDKSLINKLSIKLLEWYKDEIKDIKLNQFVSNINEHYKSIKILEEINKLTIL